MGAMHAAVHDLDQARHQQEVFLDVLDRAMSAVRATAEPVALIGELASAAFGRDRGTRDIDLFMRPASAPVVLDALQAAGFDVEGHRRPLAIQGAHARDRRRRDLPRDERHLVRR